jgi:hypothetical protein
LIFQCIPPFGTEVDLFWQEHGKNWAVEVKYADALG